MHVSFSFAKADWRCLLHVYQNNVKKMCTYTGSVVKICKHDGSVLNMTKCESLLNTYLNIFELFCVIYCSTEIENGFLMHSQP